MVHKNMLLKQGETKVKQFYDRVVIALLMIINGEIKEGTYQTSMSECLKGKGHVC